MSEYAYEVYSYYKISSHEKGVVEYEDFDNYPDAMTAYKEYREGVNELKKKENIQDWFVTLVRIHVKGTTRWHINIKHEGTI